MVAKGEGFGGGMEWEVGVSSAFIYRMDKQQGPTYCLAHRTVFNIFFLKLIN